MFLYREVSIPKRRGEYRVICVPDDELSERLEDYKSYLGQVLDELTRPDVSYGFETGKNCALMALQHIGFRYTLSIDLKNFFDHVTLDKIPIELPQTITKDCFVNGRAPQGFSTSPFLANLASIAMDARIVNRLNKHDSMVYTRYADDLVVSFDDHSKHREIKRGVIQEVVASGFVVNERKTQLQAARNGRRIITGIGVGDF